MTVGRELGTGRIAGAGMMFEWTDDSSHSYVA